MLRPFRSWLRVVLPLEQLAIAVVGLILLLYALRAGASIAGNDEMSEQVSYWLTVTILLSAGLYATFRVVYFNPVENQKYGDWLVNSVWDSSQPLPLGPLHLVWQDVVVVAILTVLFPPAALSRLTVPTAFLLVYCLGLAYSQFRTGNHWSSYGIAFLGGCFILAILSPWARLAIAAAMYAICFLERQWLLGRFPFARETEQALQIVSATDDPSTTLGWPAPPVQLERRSWRINHVDAAFVGAIAAWLLYCIGYHFRDFPDFENRMRALLVYSIAIAMPLRILIYAYGYAPPISMLGRIATGRLIIPRYDVVLAAPLFAAIVALLFNLGATYLGVSSLIATPIACGMMIWLCLALPPRREDWHYTGHHRIAYRFRAAQLDRSNQRSFRLDPDRR